MKIFGSRKNGRNSRRLQDGHTVQNGNNGQGSRDLQGRKRTGRYVLFSFSGKAAQSKRVHAAEMNKGKDEKPSNVIDYSTFRSWYNSLAAERDASNNALNSLNSEFILAEAVGAAGSFGAADVYGTAGVLSAANTDGTAGALGAAGAAGSSYVVGG